MKTQTIERNKIRAATLARRDGLPAEERRRKSLAIMEKLRQLAEFKKTWTIFTYVNFRSEVETLPLINHCLTNGLRVAVPLTDRTGGRLVPYLIKDPVAELRPGYCGIPEPDPQRAIILDPKEIDTVILPGSAFDVQGGRLGYGGGYYDRFLANETPGALRIGLAYDLQIVKALPLLPHDLPVHILITEEKVLKP